MTSAISFQGIPFARVPQRFDPPEPVPLVELPSADSRFGPAAPQNPDKLDHIWGTTLAPGSEADCLTLNVRTPAADTRRRPVLVWIHGGAFVIGSGSWPWYDGTAFSKSDVVLVTINYRLGAFGYLDLTELGGHADSGNLGLLDQIEALKWVKANIEKFGGDPDNVTICGESAGGISVCCLMAGAGQSGLFHKAISMSGPPSLVRSTESARRVTRRFLRVAGVESIEELRALPAAQMLAAQRRLVERAELMGELLFGPTVRGAVLPDFPLKLIGQGKSKHIPLLAGTTLDEARLWSLYFPVLRLLPLGAFRRWFETLGVDPDAIRAAYRTDRPDLRRGNLTMAAAGDALFWLPQLRLAEAQSRHRSDTRVYQVNWQTPVRGGRLGAPHGVEVPFLFGTHDLECARTHFVGDGGDRDSFCGQVHRAWANFARTGDPSHDGLPHWPAFDPTSRATMLLDRASTVQNDPQATVRQAWSGLAFDGEHPSAEHLPRVADVRKYLFWQAGKCLLGVGLLAVLLWLLLRYTMTG